MIKQFLLRLIRFLHVLFAKDELPDRIAVYFHEVNKDQREEFSTGLKYLVEQGYQCVDAREYIAKNGPAKRLFISFDDNFKDWHEVLDLMDEIGVHATFYVNTGVFKDRSSLQERQDFMQRIAQPLDKQTLTVPELHEIVERGHKVGCHTHSHPVLSQLPQNEWEREIAHSKAVLERLTGMPVEDFSFPYGMRRDFSPELANYCRKLGFKTIATGISGQLRVEDINPFQLHRTGWKFGHSLASNLTNLKLDGRMYNLLFGRSVIG